MADPRAVTGTNPLRARDAVRRMLTTRELEPHRLIQILLVTEDDTSRGATLPTVTLDTLAARAQSLYELGIGGLKLFAPEPIRDDGATRAVASDSVAVRAIREAKRGAPDLALLTENCLCSYTSSGSCVIADNANGVDRSATLDRVANQALLQARAGADILGPASMMDGTVAYVRQALNEAGFEHVALMPHVEFASSLYKAYRRAAGTGDGRHRQAFQIETGNAQQFHAAAREMVLGGASMLLVEPGLFFLDMIKPLKDTLGVPVGIFSVSGERVLFAGMRSSLGEKQDDELQHSLLSEYYVSAFRAGADFIASYDAESVVHSMKALS